jgi:hypothetical protein
MNNGVRYAKKIKCEAIELRKEGQTHREISKSLGVSLGSVWIWTKGVVLTLEQKQAIGERRNRISLNFGPEQRKALARKNLSKFWKPRPTNMQLLGRIIEFFEKTGRIPFKKEFNNTYEEYKKRFGSWNNAIKLAGFNPNPIIFSKKYIANDGHICDSLAEKIIDDWLSKNHIQHFRNYPYIGTKMTADFVIGKTRIEYFGLAGQNKTYDSAIRRKRNFCLQNGLKLKEIYPLDLFSRDFKKCLKDIISN